MTVLSKDVKKANNNSLNKNDMWSICKRLQQFSKQEAGLIAIGACALIVNSATNLAFPIMIGDAFDNGMNVKYITSDNFYSRVAILLCGTCASLVRVYCFGIATDRISNRIKQLLFSSYLDQDVQFFDEFSSGDLITALDKDVKESSEFFTDKIPFAIRGLSSTVFGTYYLFKISPTLVGVTCLSIPVIAIGAVSIQAFSSKHKNSMRNMQSEILTYVSERVRNMSTIHLNGKDNYERKRFQEYNDKSFHFASNMYFCSGLFVGFINFATNTSLVAILYYGGKLVANNTITPGELMSFLVRSGFVGLGIAGLSESYSEIMSSISASAR
jgi:ABC-type multidrug transport system fused ATPase/permease subunit